MSKFRKYSFNPETLMYEIREVSKRTIFARATLVFLGSVALAVLYFFLYTTIRDERVDCRVMDRTVTLVEPLSCDCCTDSKRMSLTERTARVLDHTLDLALRVSGRN